MMPWWPFNSSAGSGSSKDDTPSRRPVSSPGSFNGIDWEHYKDPRSWIPTVLVTTTVLVSLQLYRSYLRRIPGAVHVQPSFFRKRSLLGKVTSVGDGDNFHFFHTPGGRLAGWGWVRKVPDKRSELKNKTVCVNDSSYMKFLAGVVWVYGGKAWLTHQSQDTHTSRWH
jgi:hypothetical protein